MQRQQLDGVQYQQVEATSFQSPIEVPDYTEALQRNAEIDNTSRQNYLSSSQQNDKTRLDYSKRMADDVESLSKFSTTLTEKLVKRQEEENERIKDENIALAMSNPVDLTDFNLAEQELRDSDTAIQTAASQVEQTGVTPVVSQELRNKSGWARYGYAVGLLQQAATQYSTVLSMNGNTPITITDENGNPKTVTIDSARTEPERFAAIAAVRSKFLSQFGDLNPAMLEKYLLRQVRADETNANNSWSVARATQIKDENIVAATEEFNASGETANINRYYQQLTSNGMKPSVARKQIEDQLVEMVRSGKITDLRSYLSTQPYGPGGTWLNGLGSSIGRIERKAEDADIEDFKREQDQRTIRAKQYFEVYLGDPNILNIGESELDKVEQDFLKDNPGTKLPTNWTTFRANQSLNARNEKEDLAKINALADDGLLTYAELNSGKYDPDVVREYIRQNPRLIDSQNSGQFKEYQTEINKEVTAEIRLKLDSSGSLDKQLPSNALRAINYANATILSNAKKLLSADPNLSVRDAIDRAKLEQIAEIQRKDSKTYEVDPNGGFEFFDVPENISDGVNVSIAERNRRRKLVFDHGLDAFNPDKKLITTDIANLIADPKNSSRVAPLLLSLHQELVKKGITITPTEMRSQLLKKYGVEDKASTGEPDPVEVAVFSGQTLEDARSFISPTQSDARRMSLNTSNPPLTIRQGVEGGRDVMQAVTYFGFPKHLAPLAAAVFGIESGWGKYDSGKNNIFNIKGQGTYRNTREQTADGTDYMVNDSFRDYNSRVTSAKDFVELLQNNPRYAKVLTARTPAEALQELKAAGYATDTQYVEKTLGMFSSLGIDPYVPYQPVQLTASPWSNVQTMDPDAAAYIVGNIGPTSTGPHLDVKRADGRRFDKDALNDYVYVDDPELGRVPLGDVPITDDFDAHVARGSDGIDYGLYEGTKVFVGNGAKVISNTPSIHGDVMVIRTPDGTDYRFIHGKVNTKK